MENTNQKTVEPNAKKMATREDVENNYKNCYVVGSPTAKTKKALLEAVDIGLTVYCRTGASSLSTEMQIKKAGKEMHNYFDSNDRRPHILIAEEELDKILKEVKE